jgi:tetratricopeptide (TPR) repeat protein
MTPTTHLNSSLRRGLFGFVAPTLLCAGLAMSQTTPQSTPDYPDELASAMRSFITAQQEALESGDPDRILSSSSPVAVASLALLSSLDEHDQQARNAVGALSYAQGLVSELSTDFMLLRMELRLGQSAQAAELKMQIINTNPEDPKLHGTLAQIFQQAYAFDDAVREAQRAVDLDPKSRDAQIALGMAYWGLNAFEYNEETLRAFSAAQQLDPRGFTANLLLGYIESQYRQFDDAATHLGAAIAADASAPEPWYQLGMNAYEQSRDKEASELLSRYVSLAESGKSGKPAQLRLALLTLDEIAEQEGATPEPGRLEEEQALKMQLLQTKDANEAELGDGSLPMGSPAANQRMPSLNRPDASNTMASTLDQLRELAASSLADIGTTYAKKGNYRAAFQAFKYAADEDPDLESLMRNLGLSACMSESYAECAQALGKVVAADPNDGAARGYLAYAELETGANSEAATNFASLRTALASHPLFEAAAAAAFARTGDRDRAHRALDDLKNAKPDPQLEAQEAVAYLDLGDADRAMELATAAPTGSVRPPAALRVLGQLDLERGHASAAVAEFQAACTSDHQGSDDQLECKALLAEAMVESGKKSEGEDLSHKLANANPKLAHSLLQQGWKLLQKGDTQAAYGKFAGAHALARRSEEARAAFGSTKRALHLPAH